MTTSVSEIDNDILKYQRLLASSPRSDPRRPYVLMRLARRHNDRFSFLDQKGDIDKSVTYATEAVLLPSQIVVLAFFSLANILLSRGSIFEKPEDIKFSVKYFRLLQINCHTLEACNIKHWQVTEPMIQALAHHSVLKPSNMIQDIKEMAALTHGLLSSDVSKSDLIRIINTFYEAVTNTFHLDDAKLPLEKVVQVLREVEMILPPSPGSDSGFDCKSQYYV
ncbi:hypothetical protein EI94DRAFT_1812373 [Lactarius quietus]|nr:hypothetical protein EI94DRAFT_1812373 [Lactarius quietus]